MELLIAYNKQYGFNCTNLIPVNMYGPNDNFDPAKSHVIPALILKFAKAIKNGESTVELWGTGSASREFLYVDDCASAISQSLERDTTPYPINIGTCSEITIKKLAETLADIMGYEGGVAFNPKYPDGQPRRCLDTSRAYKVLGFEAKTELYKGLKETVSWFYKNEGKFVDYFNNIQ